MLSIILHILHALFLGAIGGEGHALWRKFIAILFKKNEKTVDQNLQWALYQSIILAQKGICNECLDKLDIQDKDIQWFKQKIALLKDDLEMNDKANFSEYTTDELTELESYLTLSDTFPREKEQKVKKGLAKYVTIDKEAPECYKKKIKDKLYDYTFFSFVEVIQQDKDVHEIFYKQLAAIHKDLQEFQNNTDKMLSSFYGMKYIMLNVSNKCDIIKKNTTEIKKDINEIKKIINHFEIEKITINRIGKKDIIESFENEKLKFEMDCWLIKGLFTIDDVLTKSKDSFIYLKKYIPAWEYNGHYSGTVTATIVTREDKNGMPLDTIPFSSEKFDEQFNEYVTGADLSNVLKLYPSELGSLWGVASNYVKTFSHSITLESRSEKNIPTDISKYIFICISKITEFFISLLNSILNWLSIRFEKNAFAFLKCIVEEINKFNHYYKLIDINLGDLSKEKSVEFFEEADLTVTAEEFIVEIDDRYKRAKKSTKRKLLEGLKVLPDTSRIHTTTQPKTDEINIVYIPVWIAIYSYNNKKFVFAKNLHNSIHRGIKPQDNLRILITTITCSLGILFILNSLIYNSLLSFILAFILFFIPTVIISISIKRRKDNLKAIKGTSACE